MTITDMEDLLDELLEAETDHSAATFNGGSNKYQDKLCIDLRKKLMESIDKFRKDAFDAGFRAGLRERR